MNTKRAFLILCLVLTLVGCVTTETISLPVMPKWQAPDVVRAAFTADEVRLHASLLVPGATVDLTDAKFTIVNHETAVALINWADAIYRTTGHGYTAESWDCDKFAKAYSLAVEWCASRAGVKAQPLVARIFVDQRNGFGGVPGTTAGSHALAGLRTDRGYFVLETQPGRTVFLRLVPLVDYANRIYLVRIGG